MKRTFALIFVFLLVIGIFGGCNSNKSTDGTDSALINENGLSIADVSFVDEEGAAKYNVVRPEVCDGDVTKAASLIVGQMKKKLGVAPKNKSDEEDGTDMYEILIGDTNRPETAKAKEYMKSQGALRYKDYVICTIGKKIVIYATNPEALTDAAQYFVDNYLKSEGVAGGIDFVYKVGGDFAEYTINGVNIGEFCIVRPHINSSYLTQLEMEKLVDSVYADTGYKLNIEDDKYENANEIFEVRAQKQYEIIVGNTLYDGVTHIDKYDQYDIKIAGDKVYINGGTPHATALAVTEFAKLLKKGNITDADSALDCSYEVAIKGYDLTTTYSPVYYDEFDGDKIDTTKWHIMSGTEFGREGQNNKYSGMSNDPNYVYVKDGCFYIQGYETNSAYYGGTITNNRTMEFHYGYVEKSAIAPHGDGFWSLLWFCGSGNGYIYMSPEIDLNECFGNGYVTAANCHAWPTTAGREMGFDHTSLDGTHSSAKKYWCPGGETFADNFHTYGFLWDEDEMTFTADGKVFFSYTTNTTEADIDAFVNSWMYMQLSFSVGRLNNNLLVNNLTGDQWRDSSRFIVDFVYLYQLADGKQGVHYK